MGEQVAIAVPIEPQESGDMFQSRDSLLPSYLPDRSGPSSRFCTLLSSGKSKALLFVAVSALVILAWATYRDSGGIAPISGWATSPRPEINQYLSQSNYLKYSADSTHYKIAIISDMDTASAIDNSLVFKAEVKEGRLIRSNGRYSLQWDLTTLIKTEYNEKGRGMELSELIYYNNMLLSCDDRTGIVYEISLDLKLAIPRWILPSGDGRSTAKGLKCEWMTVKDEVLYAGSIGKEFMKGGKIVNQDNTWVKTIDRVGGVRHIDWRAVYEKLREATGTQYPGYMVHEAVMWSEQLRKWVFLPRRVSKEAYDEKQDELKGSNLGLIVSEDFSSIKQVTLGPQIDAHGFSSFKFIPFRENEIIALKSEENGDTIKSYMTVFDILTGEILMDETEVSATTKFEGVEIL